MKQKKVKGKTIEDIGLKIINTFRNSNLSYVEIIGLLETIKLNFNVIYTRDGLEEIENEKQKS